ncbi:hypothetical protein [Salipiger bermudensis]|uniref:hypothetical protein n=1 Tax=Salipiger bermudensis TaxID=344736 RepID=UPI001CD469ED|nr:hypothetical protein [Salipiger bermudensis]MCA1288171.1 hypothetical protein [Salipiger bermudensis]
MRPNIFTISLVPAVIGLLFGALTLVFGPSITHSVYSSAEISETSSPIMDGNSGELPAATRTDSDDLPGSPQEGAKIFIESLKILAWPITILIILMLISFNSKLSRVLGLGAGMIRTISGPGVKIEINSEMVSSIQRHLQGSFNELVSSAAYEYDQLAYTFQIPLLLKNAVINNDLKKIPNYRATIHVPDVIFPEYLYQLVDYFPAGGGAHRRNSHRFGIIGQSWRMATSEGTGDAFSAAGSVEALVKDWGMTLEEAQGQVSGRPSCLSIIMQHSGAPVGILYLDSTERDAFGADGDITQLISRIEQSQSFKDLASAVASTMAPMRTAAPKLNIKGQAK